MGSYPQIEDARKAVNSHLKNMYNGIPHSKSIRFELMRLTRQEILRSRPILSVPHRPVMVAFVRMSGQHMFAKMNACDWLVTLALGSTLITVWVANAADACGRSRMVEAIPEFV